LKSSDDDPPGNALRRLIGCAERMPLPSRGDVRCQLLAAQKRFELLRTLGVEGVWMAHAARRFDSSLLLDLGALTTNRLIALAEALPGSSFGRQDFFELMQSRVESHREMDTTWRVRTSGVQALIAAQRKIDFLERAAPLAAREGEIGEARCAAVDGAVYIAFFLEAWWRRHE